MKYFIALKSKINKRYWVIASVLFLLVFYAFLYKIYVPRVNAFGCFDDCDNFMGGYFLLHGKRLFSQIFFNHNPLMAYISFMVQLITHPQNLYELILRHRQVLLLFGFFSSVILVLRFGLPAIGFVLFYELTKFYLFGDRFLAEGFIAYTFVYVTGVAMEKLRNKKLTIWDYLASGVYVWFIIFMREPYVPAAIALFTYILSTRKHFRWAMMSLGIFIALSFLTVFSHDVKDFFFNVVTVNIILASSENSNIISIIGKAFFYPIQILFGGEWGYFRFLLLSIDLLFLMGSIMLFLKRQLKIVVFAWVILGLVNLRFVQPGKAFYGAFHLLCWYALCIFLTCAFVTILFSFNKKLSGLLIGCFLGIILFHILSPLSFLHTKTDPYQDLIINYGIPMQIGIVVNELSTPSNTLFVDGFNDIIYWQSQRLSPYKYSWYTGLMPDYKKYTDERITMFKKSPPDFYYGSCPQETNPDKLLPIFVKKMYVRFFTDKKPSCLWVKKTTLASVSVAQWKKAESNRYYLP